MRRVVGIVLCADLATKAAAVALGISLRNNAYALGVVGGAHWLLVAVSAAVLVAVTRMLRPRIDDVAWALIVGGAAANFVDRVATGAVHDFIPAGAIVFNLGDLALVAGIALAVVKRGVSAPLDPESGMATPPLH